MRNEQRVREDKIFGCEWNMIEQQISMFEVMNENGKYVRRIRSYEAVPFIEQIHYSRKCPNITDAFGLFVDGEMVGVVTYGIPASPNLCMGLAGKQNANRVKELNRLVIKPIYNGGGYNYASYLVSHSLKMLENGTFVVSYADTAWSHVGYVYQACNFLDCIRDHGQEVKTQIEKRNCIKLDRQSIVMYILSVIREQKNRCEKI